MALKSPYRPPIPKPPRKTQDRPRGPTTPRINVTSSPKSKALARETTSAALKPPSSSRVEKAAAVFRDMGGRPTTNPFGGNISYVSTTKGPEYNAGLLGGIGGSTAALPTAGVADATIKPIHDVQWKAATFNLQDANAPSWWKPLVPKDAKDAERPDVQFLMMLNTMIPYLSPEDQRNAAAQIYASAADAFSYYKPEKITVDVPVTEQTAKLSQQTGLTTIDQSYYQSRARSRGALEALNQMREQTVGGNRWKLGPGYTWMQQVLGGLEQYGGGPSAGSPALGVGAFPDTGDQTRSQFLAQQGALDPLLAQSGTAELGGIGAVGRMFSQPFFSQGAMRPTMQGPGGRTFFGQPSGLLAF